MKKILVIGLAAAMMTSTAFASTVENQQIQPGAQIVFQMSDFVDQNKLYINSSDTNVVAAKDYSISTSQDATHKQLINDNAYTSAMRQLGNPWSVKDNGDAGYGVNSGGVANTFGINTTTKDSNYEAAKLKVQKVARQDIQNYDFTASNFTVTVNAPVGRNFIKNYEFDGAGNLIVNLKADYKLPSEGKPDLIIGDVTVKSKRDIKNISNSSEVVLYKNRSFSAKTTASGANSATSNIGPNVHFSVGVETVDESITAGNEVDLGQYMDGSWVKFTANDAYTGDVKFDGGNIQVKGKVYNGDVVNFTYDAAPSAAAIKVIQNNPAEANIMVHNIVAKNFKTGFTVSIPGSSLFGAEADANGNVEVLSLVAANNKKLYLLSNTGVLTAAPFVYNNNTAAWEGRLPAQGGTILISDVALKGVTAGTTTGTGNPSTGFGVDFSSAVVK